MTAAVGRRSPETTLTLRLLAMLLLILAVVVACFGVAARLVIAGARTQQLQDARDYFAQRIRTMDEGWRLAGFAVGQQLMLWQAEPGQAGAAPDLADARLRTLLLTLTDQGDFTHVLLVDAAGRTVLGRGSRSQDRPALPPPDDRDGLGWVWSEADRTVYRTVSMPLKLGPRALQMLLYFPIDNALLARMVYPQSQLDLLHGGAVRATASAVEAASRATLADAPSTQLPWDARPGAPLLRVLRPVAPPLTDGQLLGMLAVGALGFVGAGWWVLGRWVRRHATRLRLLREAATGFAADGALTPPIARRLDGAADDGDDIHQLADSLREMMQRIDQARADQQRAQAALAALNAGLEERVQVRTRELEAARDDALAAARAKEQFLSSMSHEIRTPMNGMLGALDLMATTRLDAEQQRFTEVAAASGAALMAVLDNVLDFAKIGAGRLQLLHEPMDVLAVGLSVTTLFAASAQRKGLVLRLEADPRLAGWRLGDAMRLRQVLLNLVGNAMKFTQRGEVVLALREGQQGDAAEPPDALHFSVRDTGPGIAEADRARIFQPFVQGDVPGRHEAGGTGLGLAISSQLVQAMGGSLVLHSTPGAGATFSFCLRLPRVAAPPAAGAAGASPAGAMPGQLHGQVLLVEDNPVNRLVAAAMLERLGLQVLVAEQGEAALAHLTLPAPGLRAVLMDCQMPVLDGYETTRRLREMEAAQRRPRLPVIALTANALSGDVQRCFAAGMDAHLTKPFTLQQLHDVLAPWCGPPPAAAAGRMLDP